MDQFGMDQAAVRLHIDRFNAAVTGGDWPSFVAGFHPDAVMTFVGVSAGPFRGRDAIAVAYAVSPPTDTMIYVGPGPGADDVRFRWTGGGTGTMTVRWRDGLIAELVVAFD
jgi:steroid delta-isomerase